MSKIIVDDLQKKYKKRAVLNGLSFKIENEILFIAGENGAGKTTLIRLILKMDKQDAGHIELLDDEKKPTTRSAAVFDSPTLYMGMTCLENIHILGTGYLEDQGHVEKVIESLRIRELLHEKVGNCSFGQQHRISVAIALIRKPVFLFLDEPTVGLDPVSWELVRDAVVNNQKEQNGCVIVTGQEYFALCNLSNKVLVLSGGAAKFFGTPDDLLSTYKTDGDDSNHLKDVFKMIYTG